MAELNQIDFGDGTARDLRDETSRVLLPSTVGWTGKNIVDVSPTNRTHAGVTYVSNGDVITINTTGSAPTANSWATTYEGFSLPAGDYTLSIYGASAQGKIYVELSYRKNDSSSWTRKSTDSSLTFNISEDMSQAQVTILTYPSSGTLTNEQVTYMLRDARITDPAYEPYHKSVDECKYNRDEANVLGAKNLCPIKAKSVTGLNGIDATVAEDGKITFTNTTTSAFAFPLSYEGTASYAKCFAIPKGTYTITVDGGKNGFELHVRGYKTSTSSEVEFVSATSYTNGHTEATFTIDNDTTVIRVYFYLANNMACDNTVSVMIRLADDPDSAYIPYAMTNRAITQMFRMKTVTATTNANGNLTASDIGLSLAKGEYIICASSPTGRNNASIVCEAATNDSDNRDWIIHCHDVLAAENAAANLNVTINILYIKLP